MSSVKKKSSLNKIPCKFNKNPGGCQTPKCRFFHDKRAAIQCKFSSLPEGCLKPMCPFYHSHELNPGVKRPLIENQGHDANKREKLEDTATETILVPDQYIAPLLGSKGSNINRIKANCTATIYISAAGEVVDGNKRKVVIKGKPWEIEEAKMLLDETMKRFGIRFPGFEGKNGNPRARNSGSISPSSLQRENFEWEECPFNQVSFKRDEFSRDRDDLGQQYYEHEQSVENIDPAEPRWQDRGEQEEQWDNSRREQDRKDQIVELENLLVKIKRERNHAESLVKKLREDNRELIRKEERLKKESDEYIEYIEVARRIYEKKKDAAHYRNEADKLRSENENLINIVDKMEKEILTMTNEKETAEAKYLQLQTDFTEQKNYSISIEAERDNMDDELMDLRPKYKKLQNKLNGSNDIMTVENEELKLLRGKYRDLREEVLNKNSCIINMEQSMSSLEKLHATEKVRITSEKELLLKQLCKCHEHIEQSQEEMTVRDFKITQQHRIIKSLQGQGCRCPAFIKKILDLKNELTLMDSKR